MIRTLNNSSPEAKAFIRHLREDLLQHHVKLTFSRSRKVRFSGNLLTAGFFQEPTGTKWGKISIGTGNRKPITILTKLANEYSHFLQWKNGDTEWVHEQCDHIAGEKYVILEQRTEREAIRLLSTWKIPANFKAIRARSKAYIAYLRLTEINT